MSRRNRNRAALFPILRKPAMQLAIVAFIAFIIYLIALGAGEARPARPVRSASIRLIRCTRMARLYWMSVRRPSGMNIMRQIPSTSNSTSYPRS